MGQTCYYKRYENKPVYYPNAKDNTLPRTFHATEFEPSPTPVRMAII